MAILSKDIKKTLLLKFTLLFCLWYFCVHSIEHHKPLEAEAEKHFLGSTDLNKNKVT